MFQKITWFISNVWRFRKALSQYRSWDYSYIYPFELEHLKAIKATLEADEYHYTTKELRRVKEAISLLERMREYPYCDMYLEFDESKMLTKSMGITRKPGVNHTKVNSDQQYVNDMERYYYLINKYSGGFWS